MNRKQKLIEQAGFSRTFEADRLNKLIELTVDQCIVAITNSSRDHCPTSYDQDQWASTIQRCVQSIKQQFR
jgi:hypothetical protein